jgi:hypothetical protein
VPVILLAAVGTAILSLLALLIAIGNVGEEVLPETHGGTICRKMATIGWITASRQNLGTGGAMQTAVGFRLKGRSGRKKGPTSLEALRAKRKSTRKLAQIQ